MSLTVQIDHRAAFRALSRVGGAVHRGTVRGLNDVAFQAMRFERGQMPKRLDRPSKFTISGTQVIRARESDAVPEATIRVEDKRAKFLRWQEEGGTENRKEAAQSRGSGSEALVIPVADIVRDHLGGAGRNAVKRALKLPRTFVARMRNQLHGGVFQRTGVGRDIRPLLIFSDQVDFDAPPPHFEDDVGGYAAPRIRAVVAMRVDREPSRAVRS
jgi:hypothetical protein